MTKEKYVYDNMEVVLTGRKAQQGTEELKRRSTRTPTRSDTLYEITPADKEDGTWKRWVKMADLYIIIDNGDNNKNDDKIS